MLNSNRIKILNEKEIMDRPYIIYWMQSSQRVAYNHALQLAINEANRLEKKLIVYFGVTDKFPEANERHYYFMLEGLKEVKEELEKLNIKMIIRKISPELGALDLSKLASMIIVDRGYLRIERQWRQHVSDHAECKVIQVESNTMIPVEEVSIKEEYSAATIRRKIDKKIEDYITSFSIDKVKLSSLDISLPFENLDISNIDICLDKLDIDRSVKKSDIFKGGYKTAKLKLKDFIENKLKYYAEYRNLPDKDYSSNLSPYLHFGQISPLDIYWELEHIDGEIKKAFLEELIVRRELSMNFVYYNPNYDEYSCIPNWSLDTLEYHKNDIREYMYSKEELEKALTHDKYWNAAQNEMVLTGKMQGYMRMYWSKKIIEWTESPEVAYKIALYLNNKYCLDGRDPNSFAGIAWCFGKHDRAWAERSIFGKIRYMNSNGLERKFNMEGYLDNIQLIKKDIIR